MKDLSDPNTLAQIEAELWQEAVCQVLHVETLPWRYKAKDPMGATQAKLEALETFLDVMVHGKDPPTYLKPPDVANRPTPAPEPETEQPKAGGDTGGPDDNENPAEGVDGVIATPEEGAITVHPGETVALGTIQPGETRVVNVEGLDDKGNPTTEKA